MRLADLKPQVPNLNIHPQKLYFVLLLIPAKIFFRIGGQKIIRVLPHV
jgi:hypothetical protein